MPINFKFNPLRSGYIKIRSRMTDYLSRRPHRSFRLTRRRDYKRSLKLPGLWKFTMMVNKMLWSNRRIFIALAATYAAVTVLLVGIASQVTYSALSETLTEAGGASWGKLGEAAILFATVLTGGASGSLSAVQQIYSVIIILLTWLASVWVLRNIMAGNKVKLRDSLYNSGSPILATFIVALLIMVQLIPLGVAIVGYSAASFTGILSGGVEAMMFWIVAGFFAIMSIYFVTSSLFALVIVTLPGMYPFKAIKISGDLVVGRRLRILGRMLWAVVLIVAVWLVVVIPTIMLDSWAKDVWPAIDWIPVVPVVFLALSSLSIVWVSSYLYMLYREIIKDDAKPAL